MKHHPEHYVSGLIPVTGVDTFLTTKHCTKDHILSEVNIQQHPVISMAQPHGNKISVIHKANALSTTVIPEVDALITEEKNTLLSVKTADCLPILIYHPKPIIAAIHAGRKGTQSKITHHTLVELLERLPNTNDLHIFFGPSISKPKYPVGTNLYFDLISENRAQILALAPNAHIHYSGYCTYTHSDLFYSYRKGDKVDRQWCLIRAV